MNLLYLFLFGGCPSCCGCASNGCGRGGAGNGCSNNCGCGNSRNSCSNNCGCGCGNVRSGFGCPSDCGCGRAGSGCSSNNCCSNGFIAPASQSNYSSCCCRSAGCTGFGSRSGVCTDWEYYARQYALCCCNN